MPPTLNHSFLVLGTANYGVTTDEATSFGLLDAYIEHGGHTIDTARCYSDWVPGESGRSEKLIGRWLKERKCRDQVLISTKGGHPPMDTPTRVRMSQAELTSDIEASRRALGVDMIDLYWLHRDDLDQPVEALLETLESFRDRGWLRHYGASNFTAQRLEAARAAAQKNNWSGFYASQPMGCLGSEYRKPLEYPLLEKLDPAGERFHQTNNVPVFPYTSQATGYYEKVCRLGEDHPSLREHPFNTRACNQIAQQLKALSEDSGHTVSSLTLAWWRTKVYPTHPVIGCRTLDQLIDSFQSEVVTKNVLEAIGAIAVHVEKEGM
jgi:aryl-alcohol dehydrogenase-like predicted oxidoreductase